MPPQGEKQDFRSKCASVLATLAALDAAKRTTEAENITHTHMERLASWNTLLALHWQLPMLGIPLTMLHPIDAEARSVHQMPRVWPSSGIQVLT